MCIYSGILILCYTFDRAKTMCSCLIFNLELFAFVLFSLCSKPSQTFSKVCLLFSYIYK